ncbi:MAG: hypothetical protein ACRDZW_01695 [Acidimicrobiales bacterium]
MRRLIATAAILLVLGGAACSASGDVDTGGDGVKIEGDIDQNK